jgi:GNAT superfamily N-acetyltransferase
MPHGGRRGHSAYTLPVNLADLDGEMHRAFSRATALVASILPRAATDRVGDWFVYDAGVDNPAFSIGAVEGEPAAAATQLEAVGRWFAARGAGYCLKLRTVSDRPIIDAMRSRFSESHAPQPYMALELHGRAALPRVSEGLCIERVSDERGLRDYEAFDIERGHAEDWSIAEAVMSLPECSLWLGRLEGVPVVRAMIVATLPVASIHNVVVYKEYWRRGFGRAITQATIDEAGRAGAAAVSLGASPEGFQLYRSMGFEHRYDLATFAGTEAAER